MRFITEDAADLPLRHRFAAPPPPGGEDRPSPRPHRHPGLVPGSTLPRGSTRSLRLHPQPPGGLRERVGSDEGRKGGTTHHPTLANRSIRPESAGMFDLDAYLARIGLPARVTPDAEGLGRLQREHRLAIPFENLDVRLGRGIAIDSASVFAKLVTAKRGGYCFEHNQLFLRVLQTIGFNVHTLSARVVTPDETPLPRTHKVLLALVNGDEWLVDVGFGGMTMTAPLRLADASVQTTPHEPWRLQADGTHYLLSACVQQQWSPKYRFSLERQTRKDYEMGNWYVATHPESRFRNDLIAARVDQGGRHALINNRYSYHRHGQSSEQRELQTAAELQTVLQQTFGLRTSGLPGLDARITGLFADKQQAPAP